MLRHYLNANDSLLCVCSRSVSTNLQASTPAFLVWQVYPTLYFQPLVALLPVLLTFPPV